MVVMFNIHKSEWEGQGTTLMYSWTFRHGCTRIFFLQPSAYVSGKELILSWKRTDSELASAWPQDARAQYLISSVKCYRQGPSVISGSVLVSACPMRARPCACPGTQRPWLAKCCACFYQSTPSAQLSLSSCVHQPSSQILKEHRKSHPRLLTHRPPEESGAVTFTHKWQGHTFEVWARYLAELGVSCESPALVSIFFKS